MTWGTPGLQLVAYRDTMAAMALEHALLVSLSERAAAGIDLTRRFDASIGLFWRATHQQIYRVLKRMEADGWVVSEATPQPGAPEKRVYRVTDAGRAELQRWLAAPTPPMAQRSELAVKMRGASWAADRREVLAEVEAALADHAIRLAHYRRLCARDYPEPERLTGLDLDHYLVLRGGIRLEQYWVDWLTEYLTAHGATPTDATPDRTTTASAQEGR